MRAVTIQPIPLVLTVMACMILSGGARAVGQETSGKALPAYYVKPSDVAIPKDVPLGQYRRIIQPFQNWTLICDENLKAKLKVCNIAQIIADASNEVVFSWSLAATADGRPVMILRTSAGVRPNGKISVSFPGRKQPVGIPVEGCNQVVCVAKTPVGPIFREHISKQSQVVISYATADNQIKTVPATLKGLSAALSAIK